MALERSGMIGAIWRRGLVIEALHPVRIWSDKPRKVDDFDALDDVAVDRLLDGAYRGDAPELLTTSQLVEEVRSTAD